MSQTNSKQMPQDTLTHKNQIKRILYATDLTKSAPKVYQYVLFLAKQFNAEIVCLHVIDHFSQQPPPESAEEWVNERLDKFDYCEAEPGIT